MRFLGELRGCKEMAAGLVLGLGLLFAVGYIFNIASEDDSPVPNQGQQANPPVNARGVPAFTERLFDNGTTHASVTGALSLSDILPIDTISSYVTSHGRATIVFGALDPDALNVHITFNDPDDTVSVTQGVVRAMGMNDDCTFNVTVTETLVAGHISCPSVDAFDADEIVGTASIELDFTAGSLPVDGGDPDNPDNLDQ